MTAPRAWQRMLSGRRLDLLDPSPLDIEIADIAHGLARGSGGTARPEATMPSRWRSIAYWWSAGGACHAGADARGPAAGAVA